jgi:hypothetical protein
MEHQARYYVMNAQERSDPFETVEDALRHASHEDKRGHVPISVACIERGAGRIIYTSRELRRAIDAWSQAHPGE